MQSLFIDDGVELAYRDSGTPPNSSSYTTVFVVHGIVFNTGIFQKVLSLSPEAGLRVVAIARRDYRHSTPLPASDIASLETGTDEQKRKYIVARGHEIALFVDKFATMNNLPTLSVDRKSGGYALFGWSLGNILTLSAIANVDTLPAAVRGRIGRSLSALIMYDPPAACIGVPLPPKTWAPYQSQYIPPEYRFALHVQWLTAYFDHGDLMKRDYDAISYVLPSTKRPPTIFNMTKAQHDAILEHAAISNGSDVHVMLPCTTQLLESARKTCFNKDLRKLVSNLTISLFIGGSTLQYPIPAYWYLKDEDAALGGGYISNFEVVKDVNHFMQWDDPEKLIELIQEFLRSPGPSL